MRVNPKYIGCAGIMLMLALVMVPLTLHEINNDGFFLGLWHGFIVVPRLAAACFIDIKVFAASNAYYLGGYALGAVVTSVMLYKQITRKP